MARGLFLFLDGHHDAAAHVLLPRIEHILRQFLSERASVIRPTDGTSSGGELTLAPVLERLAGRMDESWRRTFLALLTHPHGLNLRNELLHSYSPSVNESHCALIVSASISAAAIEHLHHNSQVDEEE